MTIGFLQMELLLQDTNSLKDKRSFLKRLINQVRKKYNVSISELSDHNYIGKTHLGLVTVSNQSDRCHQILSNAEQFISTNFNCLVSKRIMEML